MAEAAKIYDVNFETGEYSLRPQLPEVESVLEAVQGSPQIEDDRLVIVAIDPSARAIRRECRLDDRISYFPTDRIEQGVYDAGFEPHVYDDAKWALDDLKAESSVEHVRAVVTSVGWMGKVAVGRSEKLHSTTGLLRRAQELGIDRAVMHDHPLAPALAQAFGARLLPDHPDVLSVETRQWLLLSADQEEAR